MSMIDVSCTSCPSPYFSKNSYHLQGRQLKNPNLKRHPFRKYGSRTSPPYVRKIEIAIDFVKSFGILISAKENAVWELIDNPSLSKHFAALIVLLPQIIIKFRGAVGAFQKN
ncbi:hypothetical protein NPIL_335981 [Nephila pilipes]|uniref:Uncharacterized protein n=1 Tax=Nephila pilipes TaxID=299642 RepID=A0A8X6P4K6_NEPPI|nr:hypothetical protein NPIL_335981 [Nephila pilipes]